MWASSEDPWALRCGTRAGTSSASISAQAASPMRSIRCHRRDRLADTLPAADFGVVATPADGVAELAQRLLGAGVAAVTDVGSVKAAIAGSIEDPRFVAGHPMAGSEQDGLDGAAAHLFSGAMWVLCPTSTTDDTVFATIRDVVKSMGANPIAILRIVMTSSLRSSPTFPISRRPP